MCLRSLHLYVKRINKRKLYLLIGIGCLQQTFHEKFKSHKNKMGSLKGEESRNLNLRIIKKSNSWLQTIRNRIFISFERKGLRHFNRTERFNLLVNSLTVQSSQQVILDSLKVPASQLRKRYEGKTTRKSSRFANYVFERTLGVAISTYNC